MRIHGGIEKRRDTSGHDLCYGGYASQVEVEQSNQQDYRLRWILPTNEERESGDTPRDGLSHRPFVGLLRLRAGSDGR